MACETWRGPCDQFGPDQPRPDKLNQLTFADTRYTAAV